MHIDLRWKLEEINYDTKRNAIGQMKTNKLRDLPIPSLFVIVTRHFNLIIKLLNRIINHIYLRLMFKKEFLEINSNCKLNHSIADS